MSLQDSKFELEEAKPWMDSCIPDADTSPNSLESKNEETK
jgi:hypothetical protein